MRLPGIALGIALAIASAMAWRQAGAAGATPDSPEVALRADSASPVKWCDLGEFLEDSGDLGRARMSIERALELGPGLPTVLMRAANFHFRQEEQTDGMELTARILATVPDYDAILFSYYRRYGIPVADVLASGLPDEDRAWHSYFRDLLGWAEPGDAELAWARISADHKAGDELAGAYVQFLISKNEFRSAAGVWADYLGERRGEYQKTEYVFNGGFEQESTGTPLDWKIRSLEGVRVERTRAPSEEGHAVSLDFDGTENLVFRHLALTTYLPPGTYRFRAMVATEHLSTDKGLYFRVLDAADPSRLDRRTQELTRTHDWTPLEATFVVREPTALVRIELCRDESLRIDSKIRGRAWVDDVTLTRG